MTLTKLDRWAGEGPDFDRAAADAIYGTVMKMDTDSAVMFTRMIADATLQDDLLVHGEALGAVVHTELVKRADKMRGELARTAIAKSRNGQSADLELAALAELSKSFIGDLFDRSHRQARAHTQRRNLSNGQFVRQTVDVTHADTTPLSEHEAAVEKVPEPPEAWGALTGEQRSSYQQAYRQISELIKPYRRLPGGTAFVHLIDSNGQGMHKIVPINGDSALAVNEFDPRDGRKIVQAKISVVPPSDEKGAYFSILDMLGMPGAGAVAAGATSNKGVLDPEGLRAFKTNLTPHVTDEHVPSQKVLRRLSASSELIGNTLGDVAPPHAKMALALARHVGEVGPPVRDIIGPTVDRAAYRYRGTERRPDAALQTAMEADSREASSRSALGVDAGRDLAESETMRDQRLRRNANLHADAGAKIRQRWEQAGLDRKAGLITGGQLKAQTRAAQKELAGIDAQRAAADKLVNATYAEAAAGYGRRVESAGRSQQTLAAHIVGHGFTGENKRWNSGQTLGYFKGRVASPELNQMHLEAGTVPPSEGIIIDDKGRIASQAVGYGDDHYLPFTLRGLRKLRGGSYIRTRTWGGPTAEDIRTALIGGAHNLTVVSNNGVFTVDFDPTFKGGRRHNDKAHRMIGRYEHLLDVLKKGNIARAQLDPSKLEELRAEAARKTNDSSMTSQAFNSELSRLTNEQRKHPTLSPLQRNEVAEEYMRGLASELGASDTHAMVATLATRQARKIVSAHREKYATWNREHPNERIEMPTPPSIEVATEAERDRLIAGTPQERAQKLADLVDRPDEPAIAYQRAERKYVDDVQELRLDGPGYEAALAALKEQFPYYIASTKFQRWDNAAQRTDTGYVRPGANRPGAATVGFHDAGENRPSGRFAADTVRGQAASASGPRTGVTTPPPATVPVAAAATPEAREAVQARVNRDMLIALLDQEEFGPNARSVQPGANGALDEEFDLSGVAIRDAAAAQNFPSALGAFYGPEVDEDALLDELDAHPGAMKAKLDRAVAAMEALKGFPDDAEHTAVLRAFKTGGRVSEVSSSTDTGALLARPNREYGFAHDRGREYAPGSGADAEDIKKAYLTDESIRPLVAAGALPATVASTELTEKASDLIRRLNVQDRLLDEWKRSPGTAIKPVDEALHEERVHAVIAALTLQRRYEEAGRVEAARLKQEQDARQLAFAEGQGRDAPIVVQGDIDWGMWSDENKQRLLEDEDYAKEQIADILQKQGRPQAAAFMAGIENLRQAQFGLGRAIENPEGLEEYERRNQARSGYPS